MICLFSHGSAMDPILFFIHVNYVVNSITCNYKPSADDIKLYISFDITDVSSGITIGQRNVNRLARASNAWGLLTHLCPPLRSTFAVRETASLGIMGVPRLPPSNPSETIVL